MIQQVDDPSQFVLVEVYRDAEAPAKHRETAHYQAWAAAAAGRMAGPRTRVIYRNVSPEDAGW